MNGRSADTVVVEDWITTEHAAALLGVTFQTILKVCARDQTVRNIIVPINRPDRPNARGNINGEHLWWSRDVQDLAVIKERASLSLNAALRVMAAQRPRPGSRLNDDDEEESEAEDEGEAEDRDEAPE